MTVIALSFNYIITPLGVKHCLCFPSLCKAAAAAAALAWHRVYLCGGQFHYLSNLCGMLAAN
eukprot:scaffold217803_cov24-Prasinocladus_malaysianus.AAC.1